MRDEMPVPLAGSEDLVIEVISDRRAYGIALLDASLSVERRAAN